MSKEWKVGSLVRIKTINLPRVYADKVCGWIGKLVSYSPAEGLPAWFVSPEIPLTPEEVRGNPGWLLQDDLVLVDGGEDDETSTEIGNALYDVNIKELVSQ